jgi:hypothetical protein
MIYQIGSRGWPCDQYLIPGGTVVDTGDPAWAWLAGTSPPPSAMAIDQEAYDALAAKYPHWMLSSGPGVNRWKDPLG